jgi:hypothetical protein
MEAELKEQAAAVDTGTGCRASVRRDNDNMPQITKAQIDLMVRRPRRISCAWRRFSSPLQSAARRNGLGVRSHHGLSHQSGDPKVDVDLTKINHWFCEITRISRQAPGGSGAGRRQPA